AASRVGVEARGPPVFVLLVGCPGLSLGGLDEAAVPPLEEQLARNPGGAADEHIVQAVAVHVGYGDGRAVPGRLVRQERLYLVIDERSLRVFVLQCSPRVHRLERGSGLGARGPGIPSPET